MRRSMMLVTVMLISTLALALITAGCGSEGSTSGSSAPSEQNLHGKIVFMREGEYNGKLTILTAAANGTDVRQISDFGEGPIFSPDGTKVAMSGPTPEGQRITVGIVHSDG